VIVTGISTRNCVQSVVMALSVRDFHVYVPMDCTAQKDEKEILQTFSLFTSFGYRHNVTMTRSDLIQLLPRKALRKLLSKRSPRLLAFTEPII
jgi:nicotinamidase-related amidase